MRNFLVIALLCACGGSKEGGGTGSMKTIASLEDRATPVWLGTNAGKLLVLVDRGDLGRKLVEVDPAGGQLRDVAAALPGGAVAARGGKLYVGDFKGEVSTLDPGTGAIAPFAKLDHTFTSMAATDRGVLIGGTGKVTLVDLTGKETAIAGEPIGTPDSSVNFVVADDLGSYAASGPAGAIVRIDGERTIPIAKDQPNLWSLVATRSGPVWIGDGGKAVLMVSPAGGAVKTLAKAPDGARGQACAAGGDTIVCSFARPGGGDLYVVSVDPPRHLGAARASMLTVEGSVVYWVEDTGGRWTVKSTPL